jgi:hypothetical protein
MRFASIQQRTGDGGEDRLSEKFSGVADEVAVAHASGV